jgi:hypothetical protein
MKIWIYLCNLEKLPMRSFPLLTEDSSESVPEESGARGVSVGTSNLRPITAGDAEFKEEIIVPDRVARSL